MKIEINNLDLKLKKNYWCHKHESSSQNYLQGQKLAMYLIKIMTYPSIF